MAAKQHVQADAIRTVIAPGAMVDLGRGLVGKVVQVCLRPQGEAYQVAWWDGNYRKCEWLESCELTACEERRTEAIGFRGFAERSAS
jgi:hypothetical protein